jgi:hypothetical protein
MVGAGGVGRVVGGWLHQNQRACGGTREGGNRAGSPEALLLSM